MRNKKNTVNKWSKQQPKSGSHLRAILRCSHVTKRLLASLVSCTSGTTSMDSSQTCGRSFCHSQSSLLSSAMRSSLSLQTCLPKRRPQWRTVRRSKPELQPCANPCLSSRSSAMRVARWPCYTHSSMWQTCAEVPTPKVPSCTDLQSLLSRARRLSS